MALADGTLAIFHRGEGETWFGDAGGLTSPRGAIPHVSRGNPARPEQGLWVLCRRPVGPEQLPPDGPGPPAPLHPLHGRRARPRLVRLQEQGARHPAQDHADRGECGRAPHTGASWGCRKRPQGGDWFVRGHGPAKGGRAVNACLPGACLPFPPDTAVAVCAGPTHLPWHGCGEVPGPPGGEGNEALKGGRELPQRHLAVAASGTPPR